MQVMALHKPRVTVGIPVYNGQKFLPGALDAVLDQTFRDFDVVIADNASTDATQEICIQYAHKDDRIRYFRNPSNIGGPRNFNYVFEQSAGEYFKWTSADDLCSPEMLENCVNTLDSNPDVVLCYPKTKLMDAEGRILRDYDDNLSLSDPHPGRRFVRLIQTIGLAHQHQGLIRASVLRRTAMLGDHIGSDINLLAELTLYGKFREVPECFFYRRFHSESSSWDRKNIKHQLRFYDPSGRVRVACPQWGMNRGFWSAVWRAPIAVTEKLSIYRFLIRSLFWNRKDLAGEIYHWLEGHVYSGHRSG
jgi:glycosyltransferase involved in cell wall biosynthesis